jgi:D-amino-acid dehydrogenase
VTKSERHVVVVGGGLIGFSAAYQLLKRGMRVTVIERGSEADASCSTGNAGMVVPSHFVPLAAPGMIWKGIRWMFDPESPFAIRPRPSWELVSWGWKFYMASSPARVKRAMPVLRDMALRSRTLFTELAETEGFGFGLEKKGLLMLCKTHAALGHEAEIVATANSLGVEAELLDADGVRKKDPAIQMDVIGGVYFAQDCHLDPARFLGDLRAQVRRLGGAIRWGTEVEGFRQSGSKVEAAVLKGGGEISGDEFVICGGAWSPGVGKKLGIHLPMQAGKGYSVTHPDPPALPSVCSLLNEARVAVTPMGGKLRIGGTMEIVGLDESVNRRRLNGILKSIGGYFPELAETDFIGLEVWKGLRPCSPDGMPYIGRARRRENVVVATGHSMLGLSLAPVSGEMVADLITGAAMKYDMALLDPDRY